MSMMAGDGGGWKDGVNAMHEGSGAAEKFLAVLGLDHANEVVNVDFKEAEKIRWGSVGEWVLL